MENVLERFENEFEEFEFDFEQFKFDLEELKFDLEELQNVLKALRFVFERFENVLEELKFVLEEDDRAGRPGSIAPPGPENQPSCGPAALTSGETPLAYFSKLVTNIRASSVALAS